MIQEIILWRKADRIPRRAQPGAGPQTPEQIEYQPQPRFGQQSAPIVSNSKTESESEATHSKFEHMVNGGDGNGAGGGAGDPTPSDPKPSASAAFSENENENQTEERSVISKDDPAF